MTTRTFNLTPLTAIKLQRLNEFGVLNSVLQSKAKEWSGRADA
jgi:hypothetical protein